MTIFENNITQSLKKSTKAILAVAVFISLSISAFSQSPKKYLKNGFHERAFVEAVHKQNKKVKLKKKHVEVINASYAITYKKHSEVITSSETKWLQSYNATIRMTNFRAKVTHPGVYDKLENILYDKNVLDNLASKFNSSNRKDLELAQSFESVENYKKALGVYEEMATRHEQAEPISTLKDRLILIDCESKLDQTNQYIGDQCIVEAREMLEGASKKEAQAAIALIKQARSHRALDIEEEELLTLANLIIGESWIIEAQKLINTRTKKNARLAYELINRARTVRILSAEEEALLETAQELGMTRILVKINGAKPIHDAQSLSGILNKGKSSQWITYYSENDTDALDFQMEIAENQPKVVLGDIRKEVSQNTKTVEYWVEEKDATGKPVKVKKTRLAIAMVTKLSRTKTADIDWSITLKDLSDGNAVHSETKESKVEITNEFVSLESGDILALPENIESDIELDSQPFPSDKDMLNQVKQIYLKDLNTLVKRSKDHMRNINRIIE